jgi:hypothetical protein
MDRHTDEDRHLRLSLGLSEKYGHAMTRDLFWKYYDTITTIAKLTPVRPVVKYLFNDIEENRKYNFTEYKHTNYAIVSDNKYIIK